MNELKLAKQKLGPEWVDLSYGEPAVVTRALYETIHGQDLNLPTVHNFPQFQYQPGCGWQPLVDFLEAKYKAKVVVTNGARQGISAIAYALQKVGKREMHVPAPMWPSTISLIKDTGMDVSSERSWLYQPIMVTSPNNPDGVETPTHDNKGFPHNSHVIHDAAYYTPIYSSQALNYKFGNAQIFSYAKMYGLSGLRIGFVLVHDESLYPYVVEYMERSTSGVGITAQMTILEIEKLFETKPWLKMEFQDKARNALIVNRATISTIEKDLLEISPCTSNSMFAWCKPGPALDWKKSLVFVSQGLMFGDPEKIRLNIAVEPKVLDEAIKRLRNP